jgi:hypothetical protein
MESQKKTYLAVWTAITVAVSILVTVAYKPHNGEDIGFWLRLTATVVAIPVGFIGFLIGDFVRKLTIPDMIFTTGGMPSILKERLFWFCVPQLVGVVFGAALGAGIVLA